jgi:hypothetical protein
MRRSCTVGRRPVRLLGRPGVQTAPGAGRSCAITVMPLFRLIQLQLEE